MLRTKLKKIFSLLLMINVLILCGVFSAGADTAQYTKPERFLYGDVDLDGVVTVKDATCLQKGLAGLEYITAVQRYLAEPEKGNVTVKNATAIQKHIAGLEVAAPVGEELVMASQDEFSNQMCFIEDNTEIDRILVYPNNIEWEYTLEDFPEYEFEKIEVSLHKYDSYPEYNFLECILYISNPSKVNIENAIRTLDYRANLDLRGVYMITYDYIE